MWKIRGKPHLHKIYGCVFYNLTIRHLADRNILPVGF